MKTQLRTICTFLAFTLPIFLFRLNAQTADSARARIEFNETNHDFGYVPEGAKVQGTFAFRNTGTAPLVIESVKAACGCMVAEGPRSPILPGRMDWIKFEMMTHRRIGPNRTSIVVMSNGAPEPVILWVEGEVYEAEKKAEMVLDSTVFDMGRISRDESYYGVIGFTNEGDAPLIIQSYKSSCGCLVPDYDKEPVMPGERGELRWVFNPRGRFGMQQKSLTIRYNGYPDVLIIRLFAQIVDSLPPPALEFESKVVELRKVEAGKELEFVFRFRNRSGRPVTILKAGDAAGGIRGHAAWPVEAVPPGGSGEIRFYYDSPDKPGWVRRQVFIETDADSGRHFLRAGYSTY